MLSLVKPNLSKTSAPFPLAPKVSMEIAIPFMPMYLCQPKDERASSEILLVIFDGRISSL